MDGRKKAAAMLAAGCAAAAVGMLLCKRICEQWR